jgi:hypothetical protein
MLREPRQIEKSAQSLPSARKGRFQVVKLEQRIAPSTGNFRKHGHGHKGIG